MHRISRRNEALARLFGPFCFLAEKSVNLEQELWNQTETMEPWLTPWIDIES